MQSLDTLADARDNLLADDRDIFFRPGVGRHVLAPGVDAEREAHVVHQFDGLLNPGLLHVFRRLDRKDGNVEAGDTGVLLAVVPAAVGDWNDRYAALKNSARIFNLCAESPDGKVIVKIDAFSPVRLRVVFDKGQGESIVLVFRDAPVDFAFAFFVLFLLGFVHVRLLSLNFCPYDVSPSPRERGIHGTRWGPFATFFYMLTFRDVIM